MLALKGLDREVPVLLAEVFELSAVDGAAGIGETEEFGSPVVTGEEIRDGLLPVSRTPSLGVMMELEASDGTQTFQQRVQAGGREAGR